jgi:hypothetical protein
VQPCLGVIELDQWAWARGLVGPAATAQELAGQDMRIRPPGSDSVLDEAAAASAAVAGEASVAAWALEEGIGAGRLPAMNTRLLPGKLDP